MDAVAGAQGGALLNAMAPGAKLVVYGGLSGKPIDVEWSQLIFQVRPCRSAVVAGAVRGECVCGAVGKGACLQSTPDTTGWCVSSTLVEGADYAMGELLRVE